MIAAKTGPIRDRQYIALIHECPCVVCGQTPVQAAHYTGWLSAAFGKGQGVKSHDTLCAALCIECHTAHDSYRAVSELQTAGWTREQARIAHGFDGLKNAALTQMWAWLEGLIGVKKGG
jgi:uncharacterized protein YunC (DUF1805 family)